MFFYFLLLLLFVQLIIYFKTFSIYSLLKEDVSKEGKDVVSPADMKKILSVKQMEDLLEGKLQTYNQATYVSIVWCDEKQLEGIEIPNGAKVRLRTKGDGCFLGMKI